MVFPDKMKIGFMQGEICFENPSGGLKDMKWNDHVIIWEKQVFSPAQQSVLFASLNEVGAIKCYCMYQLFADTYSPSNVNCLLL